jgi:broad specificity phosphatase PhoE
MKKLFRALNKHVVEERIKVMHKKLLFVVKHGERDTIDRKGLNEEVLDFPLTPKGMNQSERAAEFIDKI